MVFVNFYSPYDAPQPRRLRQDQGFTLVESMIAVAVIALGVAGSMIALSQTNTYASVVRNSTGAYTAAMNQIDLILSDAPFNPAKTFSNGQPQIPPALKLGSTVKTGIPIYKEPNSGIIVAGTMTTTVTDVSKPYNGYTAYMYHATVKVDWTFKGKPYSFSMHTIRTSDI